MKKSILWLCFLMVCSVLQAQSPSLPVGVPPPVVPDYVSGHIDDIYRLKDGTTAYLMRFERDNEDPLHSPWIVVLNPDKNMVHPVQGEGGLIPVGTDNYAGKYYGYMVYLKRIPNGTVQNGRSMSVRVYKTVPPPVNK